MIKKAIFGATLLSMVACGGSQDAAEGEVSVEERISALNLAPTNFSEAEQAFTDAKALLVATDNDARVMAAFKELAARSTS